MSKDGTLPYSRTNRRKYGGAGLVYAGRHSIGRNVRYAGIPDALAERGPRYREPLDCDQALGDQIEQGARG
jgi:hypothetical protein